jgi:hypothetical protein
MNIEDIEPIIRGRMLRIASIKDEDDLDLPDPFAILDRLRAPTAGKIDVFTFCQRLPDVIPKYDFPLEWEAIAALDYKDHKFWFEKILDDKTRNMIRKAGKKGVDLKVVDFNDDLVRGIVEIYNETPIRQGRPFKHYGKTFDEAKTANITHLERSEFVGAFFGAELVGFLKLVYGDRTGRAEQIISKIAHRDKAPTNALLDEAVKLCEKRGLPYLVYGIWPSKESFAHFKKNNGFRKYCLPRYYVPLTVKGRIGIKLGLHRELKQRVPGIVRDKLIALRQNWYDRKHKKVG